MRLLPIITAIAVSVLIYVFIFERDRLTGSSAPAEAAQDAATADTAEAAAPLVGVVAVRSTARPIDNAVVLRGQTEAFRQVTVRAETAGLVVSEPLRKGAAVSEGDLMCAIDPGTREASLAEARARLAEALARVPEAEAAVPEAQARVEEAKARVDEAKINANAANKLIEGGFASETRVASAEAAVRGAEAGLKSAASGLESVAAGIEAAKAGVESAMAAVAAAEREIDRLTIMAPFGGILESDSAELGSLLQPGDPCATVIQLDPVTLVGFVPETEIDRITLGAKAGARLTSGAEIAGEVVFISRSADAQTRTFRVEIRVANPDLSIRDGQTAEIIIRAAGTQAHLLPQSALTLDDDGTLGVRLVTEGDIVAFRAIDLLRDTPEGLWIAGLPDQANVIVIGQEFVTDGVQVAPSYQETTQ